MSREKLPEYVFGFFPMVHKKLLKQCPESVVTKQQMNLMHKINFAPNKAMSFYGEEMVISKPNMTKLVNDLIEAGYVLRGHDLSDRRIITLELTPDGIVLVEEFFKALGQQIIESTKVLSDEEVDQLVDSFEVIGSLLGRLESHDIRKSKE